MLAQTSERRMKRVRILLAGCWLALIVSLLEEPWHPEFALSARHLVWQVLVPLFPFVLLVFGHETWRRVCPLSHLSQLPQRLGIARRGSRNARGRGRLRVAVVDEQSWLRRYHAIVQMGLLAVGVVLRTAWADRLPFALALMLLGLALASIVVGSLYGGKTWCHYFCPLAPVQRIFSGPGGLFDSPPTEGRSPIAHSTCRSSSPAGDQRACVGCHARCSDIDLEGSYWEELNIPGRRLTAYGYLGLIGGYALAHEGPLRDMFARAVPSWSAIPAAAGDTILILGGVLFATLIGTLLERLALKAYRSLKGNLDLTLAHHQSFTLATFLAFNLFYLALSQTTLKGLPDGLVWVLEWSVVVVSTIWLSRTFPRTPERYHQRRMKHRFIRQLRELSVDMVALVDGRALEELSAEELSILAQTLPGFRRLQLIRAYREIYETVSNWDENGDEEPPQPSVIRSYHQLDEGM